MRYAIRVAGLAQANRSLRRLDKDAPKQLRVAMNESAQVIVDWAQPRIPRLSGRAARSVKAQSTRTLARVVGGGPRIPYYPWLDFGGRVGKYNQVERPFMTRGRYIFEGFYRNRDTFTVVLHDALHRATADAGFEVTRG